MIDVITPGTLSESDARILSAKHVREKSGLPCAGGKANERVCLVDRAEMRMGDCVKRAEIHLSPSEKRGRYQTIAQAHADTDDHPVTAKNEPISGLLCAFALILCGLAILLAGMVLGHLLLLPDATVWPMGVSSMICAAAAFGLAVVGLRGRQ